MKTTLSEQSRRTLHRSAWLATAIIMLYVIPVTVVALNVGYDSALTLSVALLAVIPIVVALIKFFSVRSPKLVAPAAKSLIRAIILAAMVGATLAAAAIYFVHSTLNHDELLYIFLDTANTFLSSISLATSFLSTIASCIMVLRHETAATQRITKRMRLILILLIAGAISVLIIPILSCVVVLYLGVSIICIIGWFINDRIDRLHCNFNIYKQMRVGYIITAASFLLNFPFRTISIMVFALAIIILHRILPPKFIAPKPIKMHDTIYNRLAAALTLITPIFLATPMITINGALVPILAARLCSRRALQQDSNDQFAKACLVFNNCNIILCVIMFLARFNLLYSVMNIIK